MSKKILVIAVLIMSFSCCLGLFTKVVRGSSEEQTFELYNKDDLNIAYSYQVEESDTRNIWHVKLNRKATRGEYHQRFKLKFTDSQNQKIDYPAVKDMTEQEDWLIEKEYTSSNQRELTLKLPKELTELVLTVQLDEKELEKETVEEDILPENVSCTLTNEKKRSPADEDINSRVESHENEPREEREKSSGPELKAHSKAALSSNGSGSSRNIKRYTNKVPQYTTDDPKIGKYPIPSWKPDGSDTVLNHRGGIENQTGWDNNAGWNTSGQNLTDSYIHYGYNQSFSDKAGISIRKMAMLTAKEDEFKVRLNVRGETNYEPGLDIVLVLDSSKSTNMFKPQMVNVVQKLINQLIELKTVGKANIRVGAEIFSAYKDQSGNATMPISDDTANWKKIYGPGYYADLSGEATHTQRALMQAHDSFEKAKKNDEAAGKKYNRKRMILLLTDGAPTLSWEPKTAIADNTMFYDPVYVKEFYDKNSNGTYKRGDALGSNPDSLTTKFLNPMYYAGFTFRSHITTTNSTARYIKEAGAEIHTIAVNIEIAGGEQHPRAELIKGLYLMASKKANASENSNQQQDYFFRDVDLANINNYIDEWYTEVSRSIINGQINDPLGDMVELVGNPTITQVAGTATTIPQTVQVKDNRRRLYVDNLTLYKGQEVQIEYTVKLRTGASGYVPGKWYPTNGQTTLTPTPEYSPDVLDFGVPSVRLKEKTPTFAPSVEKSWEDDQNAWGLRPDKVVAILQRKEGSTWVKVQEIDVKKASSWKAAFNTINGGTTQYRIIEKDRVNGYGEATYNLPQFTHGILGANSVKMTNKLLTTNYTFKKVSHDGKTPFTTDKPKFKVTRQAKNGLAAKVVVSNLAPANDGTVKIEGLPIGSYTVEETTVPDGYKKMANFTIEVTENSAGTAVVAKVAGQGSQHIVTNQLKEFASPVEKVWEDDQDSWGLRPDKVVAVLQRKEGSTWVNVKEIDVKQADSWEAALTGITGGTMQHRIIEKDRVNGYGEASYNYPYFTESTLGTNSVKMTNKVLTTDYTFKKVSDDGKTPFTTDKPKFKVTRQAKNGLAAKVVVSNLEPANDGTVKIEKLPIGSYTVEETTVPNGYKKMTNFIIEVTENSAGTAVVAKVAGQGNEHIVINKLDEYSIPVEKIWEDEDDSWGLRPNKVVATLQRKDDNVWVKEKELDINEADSWKAAISAAGGTTLYRIIEKDRVKGYAEASYNYPFFVQGILGTNSIEITNRLLTTDYTFKKVSDDGKTPFTGTDKPKFKVTRQAKDGLSAKVVISNLEPANDGTVKIEGLPIGSYTVEETTVPKGYKKMENFTIDVTENDSGTAVVAKVAGQGNQHTVINQLKKFTLIVTKIDDKKNPLEGASFRLTGPDGFDRTLSTGSEFTFTTLKFGTYKLSEKTVPKGFVGLKEEIEIVIGMDDEISITPNELVSEMISFKDSKIYLFVKNNPEEKKQIGMLPSTGGIGNHPYYPLILACLLIGTSLLGVFLVREGQKK